MMFNESAKGRQWLEALETARCDGNWGDLPELLKKVAKHAPNRTCLIQTALTEKKIAEYTSNYTSQTSTSKQTFLDLVPPLQSAIGDPNTTPQEAFQAQVCMGWLCWVASEPALVLRYLPEDFLGTIRSLAGSDQVLAPYTEVSIVKGGFLQGAAQEQSDGGDAQLSSMRPIVSYITSNNITHQSTPQFLFWSEQLLAKSAVLASRAIIPQGASADKETTEFCLKSFRLWASHNEVRRGDPASMVQSNVPGSPGSPAATWKAYYDVLTGVLRNGLPYTAPFDGPTRVQLSSEFRRVQGICEAILLKNTKFPKANEGNEYVEAFVEQVVRNWEILCGPDWRAEDFGEGGQTTLTRTVLDILYRAASKTFHSLTILRRLFHVHSSLAEFDLAIKSLETYITLHTRAKTRAEKFPNFMGSSESDEEFAKTVSEGVLLLCCFSTSEHADKVKELVDILEQQLDPLVSAGASLGVVSYVYRAIGIGLAKWAGWTPREEERADIQASAIAALRKAASIEVEDVTDLAATFALGLLLAEIRDLDGAIECVRSALIKSKPDSEDDTSKYNQFLASRECDTVPLWHLLALLLSAKGDFDAAVKACAAGLEDIETSSSTIARQIREDTDGHTTIGASDHSEMVNEVELREKENIIELRLTQLTLIELIEGPEEALNNTDELIRMFGRLFTHVDLHTSSPHAPLLNNSRPQGHLAPAPVSRKPTSGSSRGSIFSKRRNTHRLLPRRSISSRHSAKRSSVNGDATMADGANVAVPPEGAVGQRPESSHEGTIRRHEKQAVHALHQRAESIASKVRHPLSSGHDKEPAEGDQEVAEEIPFPKIDAPNEPEENRPLAQAAQGAAVGLDRRTSLLPIDRGLDEWPNQSVSPTGALIALRRDQAQKHALCVLAKIWLFIAGLYRRLELFGEAREACNEAAEQASQLEDIVATEDPSTRGFADPGWGLSKSSDELWADIFAERGALAQAQSLYKVALKGYEEAVAFFPNHVAGTVGLCNILLDIYDEKCSLEETETLPETDADKSNATLITIPETPAKLNVNDRQPSPQLVNRLAARDRAFNLLSMLTKLGHAWDSSEAWYLFAKAQEQSGELDKARDLLWWCIELEDKKPIRHWSNVGPSGYIL